MDVIGTSTIDMLATNLPVLKVAYLGQRSPLQLRVSFRSHLPAVIRVVASTSGSQSRQLWKGC